MTVIIIITTILFLVLVGWTWSNLGNVDKSKKVGYLVISIFIMAIITLIIFSISKSGVDYQNEKMVGPVRLLLVAVFTSINGFIVIQYIARVLGRIYERSIGEEEAKKKFFMIFVIFVVISIIECAYMKNIQLGILNMINNLKQ